MTIAAVKPEDVQETALALPDEARALTITNDEEYAAVGEFVRVRCKAVLAEVNASFDPIIKKAHQAHREALDQKKRISAPIHEAERIAKGLIATYARKKEEERRKAEAEARRKAQELAEKEALERAAELENQGKAEEAEAVISEPIRPIPVVAPEPAPKAQGISVRKVWKFRVVDASKIKPSFLIPDEKKIGQVVRSMKDEAVSVVGDGIEVYAEESVSARA